MFIVLSLLITQASIAQNYPETLPEFKIFALNGDEFNNEKLAKNTYSYFIYFNPECGHCRTAFKKLNTKAEALKNANVKLYPVSANTQEKTEQFFEKYAPKMVDLKNMIVLRDDDYKFADVLFVSGYPTSYLYDQNYKLVKVYNGADEVLGFLEELK